MEAIGGGGVRWRLVVVWGVRWRVVVVWGSEVEAIGGGGE